jgi:hypothetical protein
MTLFRLLTIVVVAGFLTGCGAEKPAGTTAPPPAEETAGAEPAAVEEGQGAAPAKEPAPPPDLTRIKVNPKEGRIEIEGRFCLDEGILDYLAVVAGGREYESVLALNCKAWLLHANLLAVGAQCGPTEEAIEYLKKNPPADGKIPDKPGTKLRITIEWEKDGKTASVSASQVLFNRKTRKEAEDSEWVFTGSYFAKEPDTNRDVYMGDVDQAVIGVTYTPSAVINIGKDMGNPYDGADTGYEVNKRVVPKRGTPMKMIIQVVKPAEK